MSLLTLSWVLWTGFSLKELDSSGKLDTLFRWQENSLLTLIPTSGLGLIDNLSGMSVSVASKSRKILRSLFCVFSPSLKPQGYFEEATKLAKERLNSSRTWINKIDLLSFYSIPNSFKKTLRALKFSIPTVRIVLVKAMLVTICGIYGQWSNPVITYLISQKYLTSNLDSESLSLTELWLHVSRNSYFVSWSLQQIIIRE